MDALVSVAVRELQTTSPSRERQARRRVKVTPRYGPWSPDEDRLLTAKVDEKGTRDWIGISGHVGTRTAKQCRERWHQNLNPDLNRSPITREEGRVIIDWLRRKGPQWAEIARHLGNRSDNAVKNWYHGYQKKIKREESAMELRRKRASPQDDSHQVSSPMRHSAHSSDFFFSNESLELPPILGEDEKQRQNQWLPGIRSFFDLGQRDRQEPRGDV
ncbi:hypothetical protein E4U14_003448 [Claviceps sp. LM454 group G7]|nr:hypothetical protein E4U14_003448 [Claviceps sp. LM454 group G7]